MYPVEVYGCIYGIDDHERVRGWNHNGRRCWVVRDPLDGRFYFRRVETGQVVPNDFMDMAIFLHRRLEEEDWPAWVHDLTLDPDLRLGEGI